MAVTLAKGNDMEHFERIILNYIDNNWQGLLRRPKGQLQHPFIVPGVCYDYNLWDWDSWLTDIAITPIARRNGALEALFPYQRGCILNFCDHMDPETGWMPIMIDPEVCLPWKEKAGDTNSSKPVLVQHAVFIAKEQNHWGWLRELYPKFCLYLDYYRKNCMHSSGLFFFVDDTCAGVDNDPCVYFRPKRSCASIYLNSLMYRELCAMEVLSTQLGMDAAPFHEQAQMLKEAIQSRCWDERNGFYYSVDIDLLPIDPNQWLHSGFPRNWDTLMRRIDVWTGFLPMWAGIADAQQAKRMVEENFKNSATFSASYGIRSLSKCEKMYQIVQSGNPSCWLGPVWGICSYMIFEGLLRYGYVKEAEALADKTVIMFGRDIEGCGEMHEYYDPETGEGVYNPGFQSWNLLCSEMIAWKHSHKAALHG